MKLRPVLTVGAVGSLIAVGSVVPAHAANGQEVEDLTNSSAEALAQSLVGENIVVESATYTGADEASGTFTGFADAIGINSGVVLSTGRADHEYSDDGEIIRAAVLYGPNEDSSTSFTTGADGDADLDGLVNAQTYDAAVLEIEFVPENDSVAFNYVFGSEEYPDFVGSDFNDVFAFFVNGENEATITRSEEHTSELQSRGHLVCRLLLEKKKNNYLST